MTPVPGPQTYAGGHEYVAIDRETVAVRVPFAGEYAFAARGLKAETHPSDTRKQVDKREVRIQGSDIILA
jgi:hypothetical protein